MGVPACLDRGSSRLALGLSGIGSAAGVPAAGSAPLLTPMPATLVSVTGCLWVFGGSWVDAGVNQLLLAKLGLPPPPCHCHVLKAEAFCCVMCQHDACACSGVACVGGAAWRACLGCCCLVACGVTWVCLQHALQRLCRPTHYSWVCKCSCSSGPCWQVVVVTFTMSHECEGHQGF